MAVTVPPLNFSSLTRSTGSGAANSARYRGPSTPLGDMSARTYVTLEAATLSPTTVDGSLQQPLTPDSMSAMSLQTNTPPNSPPPNRTLLRMAGRGLSSRPNETQPPLPLAAMPPLPLAAMPPHTLSQFSKPVTPRTTPRTTPRYPDSLFGTPRPDNPTTDLTEQQLIQGALFQTRNSEPLKSGQLTDLVNTVQNTLTERLSWSIDAETRARVTQRQSDIAKILQAFQNTASASQSSTFLAGTSSKNNTPKLIGFIGWGEGCLTAPASMTPRDRWGASTSAAPPQINPIKPDQGISQYHGIVYEVNGKRYFEELGSALTIFTQPDASSVVKDPEKMVFPLNGDNEDTRKNIPLFPPPSYSDNGRVYELLNHQSDADNTRSPRLTQAMSKVGLLSLTPRSTPPTQIDWGRYTWGNNQSQKTMDAVGTTGALGVVETPKERLGIFRFNVAGKKLNNTPFTSPADLNAVADFINAQLTQYQNNLPVRFWKAVPVNYCISDDVTSKKEPRLIWVVALNRFVREDKIGEQLQNLQQTLDTILNSLPNSEATVTQCTQEISFRPQQLGIASQLMCNGACTPNEQRNLRTQFGNPNQAVLYIPGERSGQNHLNTKGTSNAVKSARVYSGDLVSTHNLQNYELYKDGAAWVHP